MKVSFFINPVQIIGWYAFILLSLTEVVSLWRLLRAIMFKSKKANELYNLLLNLPLLVFIFIKMFR